MQESNIPTKCYMIIGADEFDNVLSAIFYQCSRSTVKPYILVAI